MPALAAGGHRARADAVAELHHRDKAVAARPIPLLGIGVLARRERRERSPLRRRERNRNARLGVVELLADVVVDALESVDVAPGCFPGAEIRRELVARGGEGLEPVGGCWACAVRRGAAAAATPAESSELAAEVDRERGWHRR